METTTITQAKELEAKIVKAIQYLAGVCDFAQTHDGHGFNGFEAAFGHEMAELSQVAPLSEGQLFACWKIAFGHNKQLRAVGMELPTLDNSTTFRTPTATATLKNGRIFITFGEIPSKAIREEIKSVKGWRFEAEMPGKPWSTPDNAEARAILGKIASIPEAPAPVPTAPTQKAIPATRTQGEADVIIYRHENGDILVRFPNPSTRTANVAKVKALGERKWRPELPGMPWSVPSRFARELVRAFPGADISEDVKDLATRQDELAGISGKASGATVEINGLKGKMYPFQEVGVQFCEIAQGRAVIADDPGLGKTIQAIGYLQMHPEQRPAVIICPASLKGNWRNEIKKWMTTTDRIVVASGQKAPADLSILGASILIINWDLIARRNSKSGEKSEKVASEWEKAILAWNPQVVIADEAHYAKNMKAGRTAAIRNIAKEVSRIILMTGTPVTNRPAELFPLLNMVDPQAWPNFFAFARQYCNAQKTRFGWDFGGASNLEELHAKIKPYVIRRKKMDVLKELPPKRRAVVTLDISEKDRVYYNRVKEETKRRIEEATSKAAQITSIETLKQAAVKAKLPGAIEWIENFLESGNKLVVFATHHSTVYALEEAFKGQSVTLTGETSPKAKEEAVRSFQTDDRIRLFIGNIQAAGVGHTLTAASDVAFIEFAWTPGDMVQAEDRVHRITQTESVTAWMLVAEDTIDEKITALLEDKRQVVDTIHDGTPGELNFDITSEILKSLRDID